MSERSIKRWLVASLVLNLFIVGGVVGGAVRWWLSERASVATAESSRGLRYAADELSASQRRTYLLSLRDARRAASEPLRSAREGRQQVLQLMRDPELDAYAVAQALARTREADMAARARFEATVVDFARTLSLAERQTLADGLARHSMPAPGASAAKP